MRRRLKWTVEPRRSGARYAGGRRHVSPHLAHTAGSAGSDCCNARNGTARCAERLKLRDTLQAESFGTRPMNFGVGRGLHPRKAAEQTERQMTRTRIHNFSISLDGFATGEGQALDTPFGHAGHRLHEWMMATRFGAPILGREGGTSGVDDAFAQQHEPGIGAEIMGANKFGPPGWQDDRVVDA